MPQPAQLLVHEQPDAVDSRLAELGLNRAVLSEALLDGEAARESCTIHDPPGLPGILGWGRTVRGLRDRLVPDGWTASDERNYSTIVSPDGCVAIAVATGDEGTGQRDGSAGTKYSKGPATALAVERNQQMAFEFPGWPAEVRSRLSDRSGPVTWLLLVRRRGKALVAELSRPTDIDEDGKNIVWAERILLGEIDIENEPSVERDQSAEIEIEIERLSDQR